MITSYSRVAVAFLLAVWVGNLACSPRPPFSPSPPDGGSNTGTPSQTITGQVREANGPPLGGVTIRSWALTDNGQSVILAAGSSAADGTFSLRRRRPDEALTFELPGYVTTTWRTPAGAGLDASFQIDMKIQRLLVVSADSPLSSVLTSDDVTYTGALGDAFADGEYACGPCKLIQLAGAGTGATTLRLTWSGDQPLSLWVGDTWNAPLVYARRPGESEITVTVNPTTRVNTVMVGIDLSSALARLAGDATFTLTLEAR